ncbi:MAG: arginine--tRNA ligase [Methanobacteriota archaeon]|nr:MAG: arginine--tRNA ligase [Euryarchaeota archaeon]
MRIVERLIPLSKEEGGAHYLDLSAFGLEGDAAKYVFVRRDGTSLYTTRDIAYHLNKMGRCDVAIDIVGEDHKLSFQRLKAAFQLMGIDWAPETIFYAFVNLPEGRMSTRKGRVVYLDDLIDEAVDRAYAEVTKRREDLPEAKKREIAETIGVAAVRYNMVRVQSEKAITFRWEEALSLEGNSAPFLQYAHARACSILGKAGAHGPADLRLLVHPQEQMLIRWIAKFPSTVRESAEGRRVHAVAAYAADFTSQFNQFYRDCPVLSAEPAGLRGARIDLVDASRIVLRNALDGLGLRAPAEM